MLFLYIIISLTLFAIINCQEKDLSKVNFQTFNLSKFEKRKTFLPLVVGDYFQIEVFVHSDEHEWYLSNLKDIINNRLVIPLNLTNGVPIFLTNRDEDEPSHLLQFKIWVNNATTILSNEELVFKYREKLSGIDLFTKTVDLRILPRDYLDILKGDM